MIHFDREELLNILYESDVKLTALTFIKEIKSRFSISASDAKKVLQSLIDDQELSYHYLYGATYIEKSFLKPVQVTTHFLLKPPGYTVQSARHQLSKNKACPNRIDLIIEQGISFGSGQHPTTRLCLTAIEFCLFKKKLVGFNRNVSCADIGTGSGVLALAMCLTGFDSCKAYEIDPVSISEAKRNIKSNQLTDRIKIFEVPFKESTKKFSMISANLRYPTLVSLSDIIFNSLVKKGVVILSGVREWEKEKLLNTYSKNKFELIWQQDEKKWSAFVFIKKS